MAIEDVARTIGREFHRVTQVLEALEVAQSEAVACEHAKVAIGLAHVIQAAWDLKWRIRRLAEEIPSAHLATLAEYEAALVSKLASSR